MKYNPYITNTHHTPLLRRIVTLLTILVVMGMGKSWAQDPIYWTQLDLSSYSSFGGGTGTEADPYVISSPQHLARLAYLVNNGTDADTKNKYFIQRADIDLSGYLWEPIGKNATYTFLGNYDGQGHTISNMLINETYTAGYPVSGGAAPGYGLFGSVNGNTADFANNAPVIENVVLVNPSIILDCAEYNKYTRVGLLVAALGNGSTLQNCNVQGGSINITNHKGQKSSANMFIGGAVGDCAPGFAGYNTNSTPIHIKNISVDADITIQASAAEISAGTYQGCYQYNAGGIVGRMRYSRGPLVNCYYTGKIDAQQFTVSPSYGAVRNTSASGIANAFNGQFYTNEQTGMKVYYGDYQVKVNGEYRTPTPKGNGTSSTFGSPIPTGNDSQEMFKAQGLNGCDKYLTNLSEIITQFNASFQSPLFDWVNHDGKLQLHRVDDATIKESGNILTVTFNPASDASGITYHWFRNGEVISNPKSTFTMPTHSISDIEWSANVSYTLNGNTYTSNTVYFTQMADCNVPEISLAGDKPAGTNDLTLTASIAVDHDITLNNVVYHWKKDNVEYATTPVNTASFTIPALTFKDVDWKVYATYTFNDISYETSVADYTQVQATMVIDPSTREVDGVTKRVLTAHFGDYGGVTTSDPFTWTKVTYNSDGTEASRELQTTTSHELVTDILNFEVTPVQWEVYGTHDANQSNIAVYRQQPTTMPELVLTYADNALTATLQMDESHRHVLGTVTYHWMHVGVDANFSSEEGITSKSITQTFNNQQWEVYATFENSSKTYTTNTAYYTVPSSIGIVTPVITDNGETLTGSYTITGSLPAGCTVTYSWKDSEGHTIEGSSFTKSDQSNALWVELYVTITKDSEELVKSTIFRLKNINVVYIQYSTTDQTSQNRIPEDASKGKVVMGDDFNDGLTPDKPVHTWKTAYSLLDPDASWEENIIVVLDKVFTPGNVDIMRIQDGRRNSQGVGSDTGSEVDPDDGDFITKEGIAATITGTWPWEGEPLVKGGKVFVGAGADNASSTVATSKDAQIGAPTRFKDIIFFCSGTAANARLCLRMHDALFDTGCVMQGMPAITDLLGGYKYPTGHSRAGQTRKSPNFQVVMLDNRHDQNYFSTPDRMNDEKYRVKPQTVEFRSGRYGRVCVDRLTLTSIGSTSKSEGVVGNYYNPYRGRIIVDIAEDNPDGLDASDKPMNYEDDIAFLCPGLTEGGIFADTEITIKKGKIATLIAANQGNSSDFKGYPGSSFFGRSVVNINAVKDSDVEIQRFYNGSLGREFNGSTLSKAFLYGQMEFNMTGGTIQQGVYGAAGGIAGLDYTLNGRTYNTYDDRIPYPTTEPENTAGVVRGVKFGVYNAALSMPKITLTLDDKPEIDLSKTTVTYNISGGVINGNFYGGGEGYSPVLPAVNAGRGVGTLYGTTHINISGNTTITGNVYGGGAGSDEYYNKASSDKTRFLTVAQVYGNTNVNIYGGNINGNIYGGGGGVASTGAVGTDTEFLNIAKVFGNTNVTIDPKVLKDRAQWTDPNVPEFTGPNESWTYDGNIYGGGEMGAVEGTTTVSIKGGKILGNVFGGGKGEDGHENKAKVTGATKVLIGE